MSVVRFTDVLDAAWLAALRAGADMPPLRPRVPLFAGVARIGSVEPDFLSKISLQPSSDMRGQLSKVERLDSVSWHLDGDVTLGLNAVAAAMQQVGLGGAWRNEQLAVHNEQGHRVGTIERAAVRPLGITTAAVHMVGFAPDGRVWLQQRAMSKANDPGMWDTLMGGMVSAADTLQTALARETWEEAGLRLDALEAITHGGRITTRRPSTDGRGAGYVVEHIDWYHCVVPVDMEPVNQDGEVAQFGLWEPREVLARMPQEHFTTEAALILAAALGY